MQEKQEAAGLGFEPRLTDPESVSIHPWLFTAVQKTAFLSQILRSRVLVVYPRNCEIPVKSVTNVCTYPENNYCSSFC